MKQVFYKQSLQNKQREHFSGKLKPTRSKINNSQKLKIAAYNCKNVKTSVPAINKWFENNNFILLQEHWLFQFQLNLLGEICEDICFEGKAVDLYNIIRPAQVPWGYGGAAILWKKEINPLIKLIQDGNERLQCVEFLDNTNHYS